MRMRVMPKPQVLVAGALEDNGRYLFVKRVVGNLRVETIELPYALISQGSNPVPALADVFLTQLGIDAQVHEVMHETRHNSGSRRSKLWIPALIFKITAKNASAKPVHGLGYVWLSLDDARKRRLARNAEWLR